MGILENITFQDQAKEVLRSIKSAETLGDFLDLNLPQDVCAFPYTEDFRKVFQSIFQGGLKDRVFSSQAVVCDDNNGLECKDYLPAPFGALQRLVLNFEKSATNNGQLKKGLTFQFYAGVNISTGTSVHIDPDYPDKKLSKRTVTGREYFFRLENTTEIFAHNKLSRHFKDRLVGLNDTNINDIPDIRALYGGVPPDSNCCQGRFMEDPNNLTPAKEAVLTMATTFTPHRKSETECDGPYFTALVYDP